MIIQYIVIGALYLGFSQGDTKSLVYPKPLKSKPLKMIFRKPITFTPFELKFGYLNYGGKKYWSGAPFNNSSINASNQPVLLDSSQYKFDIINDLKNRRGFFIELDLIRANFPHLLIQQNYFDIQLGLGLQFIDFGANPSLPSDKGRVWINNSSRGDYFFHPRSTGINFNTSLTGQLIESNATYLYHSFGINSVSLYQSEGGERNLTGLGYSESFGIGSKYMFNELKSDFSYTLGIEIKWNRLYMNSINAPDTLSPISGMDLRSSGIFLTTGIQFGGSPTDGDIGYSHMMNNDYISATESFEYFLAREKNHGKRKQALEMLKYCQSQIPLQQVQIGIDNLFISDFSEAVEWFNTAEAQAGDELKIEIQLNRKKIASALLDSIQNYRHAMSISEAERLALTAQKIYSDLELSKQLLAEIYIDRGKLNLSIGNLSETLENYKDAIMVYPSIEPLIIPKYEELANAFIKDAYFASLDNELYLAINSLKLIVELNPNMEKELDSYIIKLESKLKKKSNSKSTDYIRDYIQERKKETIPSLIENIQMGMSINAIQEIKGKPKVVDIAFNSNIEYEMWTYPKDSTISRLYFKNGLLFKIEK